MIQQGFINIHLFNSHYRIREIYLLMLIVLVGAVLRFYKLDFQGLWYDELHSMNESDPDLTIREVIEYAKTDQPPSFFLLLHSWFKVFPFTGFFGRAFTAFIGVLGVVAMYFLGTEIKNSSTGLIAALLTSLNYFHIYYSQEVRFYTLFFLGTALSFLFFIKDLRKITPVFFILDIFFTALTVYTHYFGLIVLASQGIIFLIAVIFYRFDRKLFYYGLIAVVVVIILFLPWVPQIISDSKITFWIEAVKFPRFLFAYFYNYFENRLLASLLGTLFLIYIVKTIIKTWRGKEIFSLDSMVVLGWMLLGYGIPFLYTVFIAPMLIVRYTIFILPAVLIAITLGVVSLNSQRITSAIVAVILIFSFKTLFIDKNYYTLIKKQQWREVVKEVIKENKEPSVIFSYYSWHYNYYFKSFQSSKRSINPSTVNYPETIKGIDYVWLIQGHDPGIGATNEEIALLEKDFDVSKKIEYLGAGAILFKRKKN